MPRYIFQGTSFWVYLSISFWVMFRINCTFHGSSPADRSLTSGRQAWTFGNLKSLQRSSKSSPPPSSCRLVKLWQEREASRRPLDIQSNRWRCNGCGGMFFLVEMRKWYKDVCQDVLISILRWETLCFLLWKNWRSWALLPSVSRPFARNKKHVPGKYPEQNWLMIPHLSFLRVFCQKIHTAKLKLSWMLGSKEIHNSPAQSSTRPISLSG